MKRRDLLKMMPLSIGSVIAAPTLMQLFTSCEERKGLSWKPTFLDTKKGYVIDNLADIILPSSKEVGALDVKIPQFIDLILKEVIDKKGQTIFVKGALAFQHEFEKTFNKNVLEGSKNEFLQLLSQYFKLSENDQEQVFKLLEMEEDQIENKELYYIYKYLTFIRKYTIVGFYASKKVGTEILNYNPVPGSYEACIPASEVGNVSSI